MNRVWAGAAVALVVVAGATVNVQVVSAEQAVVVKEGGPCGMVGSDKDGEIILEGGVGTITTVVENGNKVMMTCHGTGITNESGRGQQFDGFPCGIRKPSGGVVLAQDTHATISASGVAMMSCTYTKDAK